MMILPNEFHSEIVQKGRLLPGIHGLRGIAALAVVFFHIIHVGGIKPPDGFEFIERDFGYSVHLFFIISAYSLMYSTEPKINQPNWLSDYFIKRFFRISPLFYMLIFFYIAYGLLPSPISGWKEFTNFILNLTFTFGFVPASGLLWGGWSVGVEMIFYVIFPMLLLLIKTQRAAFALLIFSIIVSCSLRSALHFQFLCKDPLPLYDWSNFSFGSNICFFAMGMYAYLISKFYQNDTKLINIYVPIVAVVLICGLFFFDWGKFLTNTSRLDIVVWGIGLTALCIWQGSSPSFLVANRFFEFLGERSFSIYLLHPVVIFSLKERLLNAYKDLHAYFGSNAFFICAFLTIVVILLFAEFSYRLIEVPGIRLGRKLMTKEKYA